MTRKVDYSARASFQDDFELTAKEMRMSLVSLSFRRQSTPPHFAHDFLPKPLTTMHLMEYAGFDEIERSCIDGAAEAADATTEPRR